MFQMIIWVSECAKTYGTKITFPALRVLEQKNRTRVMSRNVFSSETESPTFELILASVSVGGGDFSPSPPLLAYSKAKQRRFNFL